MGATDAEDGETCEYPRHNVTLSAYEIGKYEVTKQEYANLLSWALEEGYLENSEGSNYDGGDVYTNGVLLIDIESSYSGISYSGSEFTVDSRDGYSMADHPVIGVTWYGAVAFCNWLSENQGLNPCYDLSSWEITSPVPDGYRLPTEAEWERAAAWDSSTSKHWVYGIQSDDISFSRCNYYLNNPLELSSFPYTAPVGYFDGNSGSTDSPSPVGCYDMTGNASEWCHDWYSESYYEQGAQTDPLGPTSGSSRVIRGSEWGSPSFYCRSAYRSYAGPGAEAFTFGFRCARTP